MTGTLYREFTLSAPEAWNAVAAFVRANVKGCIARGRPLRIIITTAAHKRTIEQNAFLHTMLRHIAECAWWDGRQFPEEFWKEYFRHRYLLKDEVTTPDGEIIQVYWSTADLEVDAFSEFVDKVMVEASDTWGVEFP